MYSVLQCYALGIFFVFFTNKCLIIFFYHIILCLEMLAESQKQILLFGNSKLSREKITVSHAKSINSNIPYKNYIHGRISPSI